MAPPGHRQVMPWGMGLEEDPRSSAVGWGSLGGIL